MTPAGLQRLPGECDSGAGTDTTAAQDVAMEPDDSVLIARVLEGDAASFEPLVKKYQPRVFAAARRYARWQCEVEDIVQEVFLKAFQRLRTYRGEAPFEHWLMRLAVRVCFDFLRAHQRSRETSFTELDAGETGWLESAAAAPVNDQDHADAARELVGRLLELLSPQARLVITLLEIEGRSVKEISRLTGWSIPCVKIRAFRARAELKASLGKLIRWKKLALREYF